MDAYESALSILKKVPVEKQIFGEQEADRLGQLLSGEVKKHLAGAH
jgi:hypothetical protein